MTPSAAIPGMKPAVERGGSDAVNSQGIAFDGEDQQLVGDMLHDLSQPFSTLTCLLEVNLLLSRSLKQVRHDLKIALQQVRSMVEKFRGLREFWEAGTGQQHEQVLSLIGCLRQQLADLRPVADAENVKVVLSCESGASSSECLVNFQPSRLRQALSNLLQFALASAAAGSEIKILVGKADDAAQFTIEISAVSSRFLRTGSTAELAECKQHEMKRRLALAIARRILKGGQGSLGVEDSGEHLRLAVRLPSASSPK
jgi:signal transduction histidine kinase